MIILLFLSESGFCLPSSVMTAGSPDLSAIVDFVGDLDYEAEPFMDLVRQRVTSQHRSLQQAHTHLGTSSSSRAGLRAALGVSDSIQLASSQQSESARDAEEEGPGSGSERLGQGGSSRGTPMEVDGKCLFS